MLGPACFPLLKAFVRVRLQINDAKVEEGLRLSRQIVQEVDALLGDDRKYLVGMRFSAADLSLACMMAPFVLPRQYGVTLPSSEDVPVSMQGTVKEFQNTLTGRFVLRLFETER